MTSNLISPFIIYWDIEPKASEDDILRICKELADAKIFVLNLRDLSSPLSEAAKKVMDRLKGEQIKIQLTVGQDILWEPMEGLRGVQVFIQFERLEQIRSSLDDILILVNRGYSVGVSFDLNKDNFRELPDFISVCTENSITDIAFPIQRADEGEIFYPDHESARNVSEDLRKLDMETLSLSVHDPFLWKLLHDKENPNENGCNGAKTMMYISKDLEVTPCPVMPFPLGNLREISLKEIFSSAKRRIVREELSMSPGECIACDIANKCKGGCRGRTYVLFRIFDKKDPACLI